MYKYLRPVKIRRIGKSLRIEKIRRIVKSFLVLKIRRMVKSLRVLKIRRMVKSLQVQKIRRMVKSLRALKSPRLVKYWRSRKSWRPAYCLGSAESPTADFSLVSLMSTFCSSLMWWISHVVSKWEEGSGCPAFMGGPSPVLYRLFVPARHCQEMAQIHTATKSLASAWNSTDFCQITPIPNSAYKRPITEPKKHT